MSNAPFIPWRDDAFSEVESSFALLNKVSWFLCCRPVSLLRGSRGRTRWRYDEPESWIDRLIETPGLPCVHGQVVGALLVQLAEQARREVPTPWRRRSLTVCPRCIAQGVHLRLHQHAALACCPIHPWQRLMHECPRCGNTLSLRLRHDRSPFACCLNNHSLIAEEPRNLIPSAAAQARSLRRVHGAQRWLDELHARYPLNVQEYGFNVCHYVPFRAQLALEAMLRTCSRVPSWANRVDVPARLALRVRPPPDPDSAPPIGAARRRAALEDRGEVLHCLQRLGRALRLSAKEFLVCYGVEHRRCWNRPYQLLGMWPRLTAADAAVLDTCPIALGFWLWRLRWGTAHSALLRAPGFLKHTDLARDYRGWLPNIVRSHLHVCLAVARHTTRCHREGQPAAISLQSLRGLFDDAWDPACAVPSDVSIAVTPEGLPTRWRLDVIDGAGLMDDPLCRGEVTGRRGLRREEDPAPPTDLPGDPLPFTPMGHDWVFLHPHPIALPREEPWYLGEPFKRECRYAKARWSSLPLPPD
ncbi:hypothetical protein JI752_016525 [Lysobacter sp. MMG2]|uniref:hypothetical protein n=1 Tax=Lysobacter sp. MMG2 TaxID=2801338 RepID=UPI001C21FEEB|nr:hypothetical protein [Lysobacter sp. MMG2]MBU8977755.1 hypothetical protein [Lysobacter sp. MMG2]